MQMLINIKKAKQRGKCSGDIAKLIKNSHWAMNFSFIFFVKTLILKNNTGFKKANKQYKLVINK